jgi:putative solute:sodium symporter small subunit
LDQNKTPPTSGESLKRYWRTNLLIMLVLLLVWATTSMGFSILLADWLNQFRIGGFPLGFWFAQQGSIIIFVLLILVYALLLNALDQKHHRELQAARNHRSEASP